VRVVNKVKTGKQGKPVNREEVRAVNKVKKPVNKVNR
jgi:hypothetical protein